MHRFGDGALVAEVSSVREAHGLAAAVTGAPGWEAVDDVVVGYRSVVVIADPSVTDLAAMEEELARIPPAPRHATAPKRVDIPVCFDGPDLAAVADHASTTPDAVVEQLVAGDAGGGLPGVPPRIRLSRWPPPRLGRRPPAIVTPDCGAGGVPGHWRRVRRYLSPGLPGWVAASGTHGIRALRPRDPALRRPTPR